MLLGFEVGVFWIEIWWVCGGCFGFDVVMWVCGGFCLLVWGGWWFWWLGLDVLGA